MPGARLVGCSRQAHDFIGNGGACASDGGDLAEVVAVIQGKRHDTDFNDVVLGAVGPPLSVSVMTAVQGNPGAGCVHDGLGDKLAQHAVVSAFLQKARHVFLSESFRIASLERRRKLHDNFGCLTR